jgi:sugar phosphate isomerase/epimerase
MINLNNVGLNTSSLSFTLGYKKKLNGVKNKKPTSIVTLLDNIKKLGINGIEFPYFRFYKENKKILQIKKILDKKKIFCVIDSDLEIDTNQILNLIPIAKKINSKVIRIKASNILSSERWRENNNWNEKIKIIIKKINSLKKILIKNKIKIAIENHQDFDSHELKYIIKKVGKNIVGINFDIGNAFATLEDPMQFAKRLAPYIINVHIKDYKIYKCKNGITLSRCALGNGDVQFDKILPFLEKKCPKIKFSIELGALESRKILAGNKFFWKKFTYDIDNKKNFYKKVYSKSVYVKKVNKNPWEKNMSSKSILKFEMDEIKKSINFLNNI